MRLLAVLPLAVLPLPVLPLLWLLGGCGCEEDAEELEVGGAHPYTRCFADRPPSQSWRYNDSIRFEVEDRTLRITGIESPIRLVVFGGGGEAPYDGEAVRALRPDLIAVLGDANPERISELNFGGDVLDMLRAPILVVGGGSDTQLRAIGANEEDSHAVDISVFRRVRVANLELIPLAGAPSGFYSSGPDACGFGPDDVSAFELDPAASGVHRVLLSWAGPPRPPASLGIGGVEAGDPLVARVAAAAQAPAVLFAWPRESAGTVVDNGTPTFAMAVPPGAGSWVIRADDRRIPPGPTLVTIDAAGLHHSP